MSKLNQVYGLGQGLIPVLPPPIPFQTAPTSTQTNYEIGQVVYTPPHNPTAFYFYGGGGNWVQIASSSGDVLSVTGTANQILATPTTGNVVLSLIGPYTPATYTAHGVLIGEGTSSIVATATGSAGQLLTSGGASADPTWTTATFPSTVTAGSLLVGTASNVVGSIADVATGQLLASGGVGVVPAYTASPSVTGSLTAGTTITATLGAITATNGNLVLGTAGNKILSTSVGTTTSAGANSFGSVTLSSGTATVSTTSVTTNSLIFIWRQSIGATGAAALGQLSVGTIVNGTSFVINAALTATATSLATTDVSVVGWMIVN